MEPISREGQKEQEVKYRIFCKGNVCQFETICLGNHQVIIEAESDEEAVRKYTEAEKNGYFPPSCKPYSDFRAMVRIDQEELTTKVI